MQGLSGWCDGLSMSIDVLFIQTGADIIRQITQFAHSCGRSFALSIVRQKWQTQPPIVKQSIDEMIVALKLAISKLNDDIDTHINNHPKLKE